MGALRGLEDDFAGAVDVADPLGTTDLVDLSLMQLGLVPTRSALKIPVRIPYFRNHHRYLEFDFRPRTRTVSGQLSPRWFHDIRHASVDQCDLGCTWC